MDNVDLRSERVKTYMFRFLLVVKFPFEVVLRPKMRNFRHKNFCLCIDYIVGETETNFKAQDKQFSKQELLPMHRLHCWEN